MMKKQNGLNVVLLITFCTILGKALGIVRDSMISYYYGATAETDAFFFHTDNYSWRFYCIY